jgi:hypothetical protein
MAPRSMDWGQQESRCRREGDAGSMTNDDPNITSKASYLRDDDEASTAYGYWTICDLSQLAGPANRGARPTGARGANDYRTPLHSLALHSQRTRDVLGRGRGSDQLCVKKLLDDTRHQARL